jgi:hypothetical protein
LRRGYGEAEPPLRNPMDAAELPYTTEEETLADQFVKNASLVAECTRHPSQFYQARSRRDTLERIDSHLEKGERLEPISYIGA